MNWMHLVWIVMYFSVGWVLTEVYELEDDIWKLLIFLGWPVLLAGFLVILMLLVVFSLVLIAEEIGYGLLHRRSRPAGKEREKL